MANKQNPKKRMILNAFDMNCVGHQNPGMWAHPDDQTHRYMDVDYWTDLAKLLERGGFDCLFIADVLGFYDVYGGSRDTALRTAAQAPVGDPCYPGLSDGSCDGKARVRGDEVTDLRTSVFFRQDDDHVGPHYKGPGRLEYRDVVSGQRSREPGAR